MYVDIVHLNPVLLDSYLSNTPSVFGNRLPNKVISRTYLWRSLAFPLQKACNAISRDQCPDIHYIPYSLTFVIETVIEN